MIFIIIPAVIILFILIIMLESARELNRVRMTEYIYENKKLSCDYSFVFLSDFHEAVQGRLNDRIIKMVHDIKPDFILLGGDMINGGDENEDLTPAIDLIKRLAKESTVYMASGNHEMKVRTGIYGSKKLWQNLYEEIKDSVTFVDNKHIEYEKLPINIYGLDLDYKYYKRLQKVELEKNHIDSLLGKPDSDRLNILLAHNPEYFKSYADWGADIVLSGHYHGGMIRLPFLGGVISPKLVLFPKYDYGCFSEGKSKMYVTGGLGQHSVKVRFNNIPEIVVIRLRG